MAGVTKHPKSPYWTAIYYAAGQKFRRSTKLKARGDALKQAIKWEELSQRGAAGKLVERQARTVIGEIVERYTGQPLQSFTARQWFTEWIAQCTGAVSDRTLQKYTQVSDEFIASLGSRADMNIAGITTADVRAFRDKLAKDGLSPSTTNQLVRKVLSTSFRAAEVAKAGVDGNPCLGVKPLKDSPGKEREAFTLEQIGALLAVADEEWRGIILAGFTTALRLSDVLALTWDKINLEDRTIRVHQGKTGAEVVLPIHGDFETWLRSRPTAIGRAFVFPDWAGKTSGGRNGPSMHFARIMAQAKVAGRVLRRGGKGKGRQTRSLSYHSLRHAFISLLANVGVAEEIRSKLSGHASRDAHRGYTHLQVEVLRDAMSKLPSLSSQAAV